MIYFVSHLSDSYPYIPIVAFVTMYLWIHL